MGMDGHCSLFRTVFREDRGETMVLSAVGLGRGGDLISSVDLFSVVVSHSSSDPALDPSRLGDELCQRKLSSNSIRC